MTIELGQIAGNRFSGAVAIEVQVQAVRARKNQTAIAKALNLSTASISHRMSGKIPWDIVELAALAELLGCKITDFIPETYEGDPLAEIASRNTKTVRHQGLEPRTR